MTLYEESEDGRESADSRPRVWWTQSQHEHSASFIGSERQKMRADAIRAQEQIGSDGVVRALPELSISYQESLQMLWGDN